MCTALRSIGKQGSKTLTITFTRLFETSATDQACFTTLALG